MCIDVTYVPDRIDGPARCARRDIDERVFEPGPLVPHEDEPLLRRREFRRRVTGPSQA